MTMASSVILPPFSTRIFFLQVFVCCCETYCLCHLLSLEGCEMYVVVLSIQIKMKATLRHVVPHVVRFPALPAATYLVLPCSALGWCAHGVYTKYRNGPKIAEYFLWSLVLQLEADIGPYSVEVCVIVRTEAILICVLVGIINFTVPYASYPHV